MSLNLSKFAFKPNRQRPAPAAEDALVKRACIAVDEPATATATASTAAGSAIATPTKSKAEDASSSCLWTAPTDVPDDGSSCATTATGPLAAAAAAAAAAPAPAPERVATHLLELVLVKRFRAGRRATVDDFHAFLLSLGGQRDGRWWALAACLLSVQCRDVVALETVKALKAQCPGGAAGVNALAADELRAACKRCNFYATKAENLRKASSAVVAAGGAVPSSYAALVSLPGVGPKIAHLMLSVAFGDGDGDGDGIVVDTHVQRLATQLGWAHGRGGPEATRRQLEAWVPRGSWAAFTTAVVGFGQLTQRGAGWRVEFVGFVERECGASSEEASAAAAMVEKLTRGAWMTGSAVGVVGVAH